MKFIKVTVIYPNRDEIKYINFDWVLEIIPNTDNTTFLNVKYHYDDIRIRESIEYLKLEIKHLNINNKGI
jgi:hypothetical protein